MGDSHRLPWIVGVSGASGTPYAKAVIRALLQAGHPVDLIVSRAARLTILDETGIAFRDNHWTEDAALWLGADAAGALGADAAGSFGADAAGVFGGDLRYWTATDLSAGPASGSYPARGMVVVPASTAAVAGIALGLSKDLLQRAADVTLKERRPLVVVPRETPYTRATLTHLIELYDAGAVVLPASPAFYAGAGSVQQLVDFVAAKVLDVLGVPHSLITRWTGQLGAGRASEPGDAQASEPGAVAEPAAVAESGPPGPGTA
ncbi:UbiX family flavin prenyltransferase [Jatrophihabitans sp.]|uniref:UbiX family flavin prenyltransferase n=1 Tax=Jatrophihabitans sp. TaxID=1932789 RepID=UPI0038CDBB64